MGIYIRGMELPKEFDPDVYIELACGIDDKRYVRLYNFHQGGLTEWCEAVPIPPHGRLIDADALEDELGQFCDDNWVYNTIRHAPAIIPACEEVYGEYTDTAGNFHWYGTYSGEHTVKAEGDER